MQGVAESECLNAADKAERVYFQEYNDQVVPEGNMMQKEHDVSLFFLLVYPSWSFTFSIFLTNGYAYIVEGCHVCHEDF